MDRYETRINDGTVYLETDDDELEIGDLETIIEVIGGETYTVSYDERQRTQSWLETDDDGAMTVDVRETIEELPHQREVVAKLQAADHSQAKYGLPERTVEFANEIVAILDQQGASQAD
ncbi:hypothetical protein [Halomontanus rarus]|uniref:hypothetical protein n=1 Tax=Halomontanus rarus TaxID=3034020 RepID=UPI001A986BCE